LPHKNNYSSTLTLKQKPVAKWVGLRLTLQKIIFLVPLHLNQSGDGTDAKYGFFRPLKMRNYVIKHWQLTLRKHFSTICFCNLFDCLYSLPCEKILHLFLLISVFRVFTACALCCIEILKIADCFCTAYQENSRDF